MNRLWVWISVVIVGVILTVFSFPIIFHELDRRMGLSSPPPERISYDERNPDAFRESIEKRAWTGLTRTLALGAIFGLLAGVLLTRWLVAPLRQLEQGARAIAKREWAYRIPLRGSAEMRSVGLSFNQMAANLERQETLRRNMLADVTHELRHPVHILQGNLQAILDGIYPLTMDEIVSLLEQTQGLAYLVNDLHELAQAEAHQLTLSKRETALDRLVQTTVETFQPLFDEKNIAFSLVSPASPVILDLDADRIRQALQNLLGNALIYTPEGGHVKVVLAQNDAASDSTDSPSLDGYVTIRVQDSGIGIQPEDLSHVFDRFYRADDTRNRQTPGTGLGLAIAQAIVQAHGGCIQVYSGGINQGSTFVIELPLKPEIRDL